MEPVPHVLTLHREPELVLPRVPAADSIDAIRAYLTDDQATADRHVWFHGPTIEAMFPPLLLTGGRPGGLLLPAIPPEVTGGCNADRQMIVWRNIATGCPVGEFTNLPNPRLARIGDPDVNRFGLLTDWVSLPLLAGNFGPEWSGQDAFRAPFDVAPDGLSSINNPLVEVWRLQAALAATTDAKGRVYSVIRDSITEWTPQAVDYFNREVDRINTALAVIEEVRNQ